MSLVRKIYLSDFRNSIYHEEKKDFKVVKLENSIQFDINQQISASSVQRLIDSNHWDESVRATFEVNDYEFLEDGEQFFAD